jgi:hypothetical protein
LEFDFSGDVDVEEVDFAVHGEEFSGGGESKGSIE